ncbi:POT family-domain-containing protein [Polychytrium aggregatum]|uniref:POT family-domain-containing protein n=1 Tax=Polychytrium aggregatum TaxID=110093 RepID=UPI0022FEE2B5|nr:POT family-domain-containing protein [Polychytrium aggregatum]KAI9203989.1 POT family-domain-containing protein [Polychytrium aggregatum]
MSAEETYEVDQKIHQHASAINDLEAGDAEFDAQVQAHAALEAEINKERDAKIMANPKRFPPAIYTIIPNEFAERFCFYGLTPLLNDFFSKFLGMDLITADVWYHLFKSLAYFLPLVGAALSDSFMNKYNTIVSLSVVYTIGMAMLSIFSKPGVLGIPGQIPWTWPLISLVLIALGTGGIKPCVSAHAGDQFLSIQTTQLNVFYNYFYIAINVGALIAGFVTPAIQLMNCFGAAKDCYAWAWGTCTIMMACSLIVFVAGHRLYRTVPPAGSFIPWELAKIAGIYVHNGFKFGWAEARVKTEERVGKAMVVELFDLLKVIYVLLPSPIFWTAFDQNGSSWLQQGQQMQYPGWFDYNTASAVINPLWIVVLAPIFSNYLYPAIEKRFPGKFGLLARMTVGQFLAGISFFICAIFQSVIERDCVTTTLDDGTIVCISPTFSIFWQFVPYLVITAGEVLFSISGLNLTYVEVGKRTKSSCGALWLLTVAIGNVLTSILFRALASWSRTAFFIFIGALCIVCSFLQWLVSRNYVYKADRPEHAHEHAHKEAATTVTKLEN